jgi:hypothetical protein
LRLAGAIWRSKEIAMQAMSIAAAGMLNAQARFDASARRTATAPLDDLAAETVERVEARTALSANAAVVQAADEMTGRLLDILS